jgi:hypothetical protein
MRLTPWLNLAQEATGARSTKAGAEKSLYWWEILVDIMI